MKPVYSKKFGDCFSSAVASVLEMDLAEMPVLPFQTRFDEFCSEMHRRGIKTETEFLTEFGKWLEETREERAAEMQRCWTEWFDAKGIICYSLAPPAPTKGYCIAGCEDGPHSHALVLLDGKIIHDPERPEHRRGQPWQITSIHILAPRDPAMLRRDFDRPHCHDNAP